MQHVQFTFKYGNPVKKILADIKNLEDAFDIIDAIENLTDNERRSVIDDSTILLYSCIHTRLDIVEELVRYPHYAYMDYVTKKGETPLIIACKKNLPYFCSTVTKNMIFLDKINQYMYNNCQLCTI